MIKKQTYRMSQEAQETKVQGIQSQIHSKRETRQETSEVSLSPLHQSNLHGSKNWERKELYFWKKILGDPTEGSCAS